MSDVVRAGPWGSSLCGHLPGMQAERTLLNAGKTLWERGSEASVVAEERHHTPHKPLLGCMRWATHMLGGFGNPPKTLKMCGLTGERFESAETELKPEPKPRGHGTAWFYMYCPDAPTPRPPPRCFKKAVESSASGCRHGDDRRHHSHVYNPEHVRRDGQMSSC